MPHCSTPPWQFPDKSLWHTPKTRWQGSACPQPLRSCRWGGTGLQTSSAGTWRRGGCWGWQQMMAEPAGQCCGCGRRGGSPACSWGCSRGVRKWPRAAGWWRNGRESRGPTPESWCSRCYRRTLSPWRPSPDLTDSGRRGKRRYVVCRLQIRDDEQAIKLVYMIVKYDCQTLYRDKYL